MTITLHLHTQDNHIYARHEGHTLAETLLTDLPQRADSVAQPYEHGPSLMAALGGEALLALLNNDPDRTLYLAIPVDDPADKLAWECAIMPPRTFLVHRYGCLRLVERQIAPDTTPGPVRLIALGADPLVDKNGQPRTGHRLDLLGELKQIERALLESGKLVNGQRIMPTKQALRNALAQSGHTLLHLSCHGDVINTNYGPEAVLFLEDANGGQDKLKGSDLISLASLTDLRLILLSACRSGQQAGIQGRLSRTLVTQVVPAAIGMQGLFPDDLSGPFAAALYRGLLAGQPLAKALQAARLSLTVDEQAVGLPVAYTTPAGASPLPLQSGQATPQRLDLNRQINLPPAVQPPVPFLGRNGELHQLARLAQQKRVITIIGTGGMGKTALAASFVRRFGQRWPDGALALSFANEPVDAANFRRALLLWLVDDELADQPARQQESIILDQLRQRELLLLVDNYESVQSARDDEADPHHEAARAIHALLAKIAKGGGHILLTSRQQPAGLSGEEIFPGRDRLLRGVDRQAGATLFYEHSPRASERRRETVMQRLAHQVADVTGGHPLAIALLGGEFDKGDVTPDHFLANWGG